MRVRAVCPLRCIKSINSPTPVVLVPTASHLLMKSCFKLDEEVSHGGHFRRAMVMIMRGSVKLRGEQGMKSLCLSCSDLNCGLQLWT